MVVAVVVVVVVVEWRELLVVAGRDGRDPNSVSRERVSRIDGSQLRDGPHNQQPLQELWRRLKQLCKSCRGQSMEGRTRSGDKSVKSRALQT